MQYIFRMRGNATIWSKIHDIIVKLSVILAIIIAIGVVGSADIDRISVVKMMTWLTACIIYIIIVMHANAETWHLYGDDSE